MATPECTRCGACCVAPDIAALDKPLGLRCPHLGTDNLCLVYDRRPEVFRSYSADALCEQIAAATLEERVANYLTLFGLREEAARTRLFTSMRAARPPKEPAAP
ncbi:MAG: YkgJ family cysteine cluster protein [Myxococcota bacterium]|nr:YkgJ family cysteine cluster protein [Myxococcota bacterium]